MGKQESVVVDLYETMFRKETPELHKPARLVDTPYDIRQIRATFLNFRRTLEGDLVEENVKEKTQGSPTRSNVNEFKSKKA